MKNRLLWLMLLLLVCNSAKAQLHLGKSERELVSVLGNDYTKVSGSEDTKVLAYFHEIKGHPKFGNYTLYSIYVFQNDICTVQHSVMPASQTDEIVKELNLQYEKQDSLVWKSKENVYYILTIEEENLRMKVMSANVYLR